MRKLLIKFFIAIGLIKSSDFKIKLTYGGKSKERRKTLQRDLDRSEISLRLL